MASTNKRDGGEVGIHHPLNACCFRDQCKEMERALAESRAECERWKDAHLSAWTEAGAQSEARAFAEARAERLAGALRGMMIAAPGGHECRDFHHDKADRHCAAEDCRPLLRWSEAMDAARAALEQEPQE